MAEKQTIKRWAEDLNRHFYKEAIQVANKHMENAQYCLLLEKCKSKLQRGIISYWSEQTPSKNQQTIDVERVWRKGNFLHCQWECKFIQPFWKTV